MTDTTQDGCTSSVPLKIAGTGIQTAILEVGRVSEALNSTQYCCESSPTALWHMDKQKLLVVDRNIEWSGVMMDQI